MSAPLDPEALLALWEDALGLVPIERDEALLRGLVADEDAQRTLGERNALLLQRHAQLFGSTIALASRCPRCATSTRFGADCAELAAQIPPERATAIHTLDAGGHRIEFRLPRADDVAAAARTPVDEDPAGEARAGDDFAGRLLERCIVSCTQAGAAIEPSLLSREVREQLSQRMEALDPGASLCFALRCPECSASWDARLDPGELVWQKVQAEAERLLLDVDELARAYGWTQTEVLRLSPIRRAAYLQLAAG